MSPKHLSPEHLALTKFAVEEAARRGMKVWFADEGSYPSGFAGVKIATDYPQLRMQGLVADIRIVVAPGHHHHERARRQNQVRYGYEPRRPSIPIKSASI